MRHAALLGARRLRCPDIHPAVDLSRVRREDLAAFTLGDLKGDRALSGGRGTDDG
jgi:hypothetical protein